MDVALVHPWLGELRRYQDDQPIGSVDIDPSVRVPRGNGDRDVEVLLHAAPAMTRAALCAHADRCAKRISAALERLEPIKKFTAQHAPPGWAEHYAPRSGTPASLLSLTA